MNAPRRELYVYYRVVSSRLAQALAAVHSQQWRLRSEHAGLTARVLRRPGVDADAVTLMESYSSDASPCGVEAVLEARIVQAMAMPGDWLLGERHIERFDTLD